MNKEPYIKPEIKSETIKPEALANYGSPAGPGGGGNGGCDDGCDLDFWLKKR